MELITSSYEKILNFISKSKKDKLLELEIRFIEQEIN